MSDISFRKKLIDAFVNAVYLYDDRIVLTYNYKDGTRTVTMDEVEKAFGNGEKSGSDLKSLAPPAA